MIGMKRRRILDLGTFHKEATKRGLTYAQAQIEETCEKIGPVRTPEGFWRYAGCRLQE